jgi:hypothetical protein
MKASPSEDEHMVVVDGPDFDIDLLDGRHGAKARGLLENLIDGHLPRR